MSFKDHFSARSALYAAYRPHYPDSLFAHLAGIPARRQVACDCATGNGQAAHGLARHFGQVAAIDASRSQLAHATQHPVINYAVAAVEMIPLRSQSVDLVTVAQALHWFDLACFYDEARRILAPGGAIAVWGYGDPILDDPRLNDIVHRYNRETIESYWMPERMILLDGYATMPFPFREVEQPEFSLKCDWTLAELCGYLRTWSATAAYAAAHGTDPVVAVEVELAPEWGPLEARKRLTWPLHLRIGFDKMR